MKKNSFKILFSNLLILGLLFASLNLYIDNNIIYIGKFLRNKNIFISNNIDKSKIDISKYNVEKTTVKYIKDNGNKNFCGENRIKYNIDKYPQKNSIVILGCSYVYGQGISNYKTFPYLLSNLSKRPIYNFAVCGGDAIFSLMQIEPKEYILNNADYVIYVYMHDHINRYLSLERLYYYYEIYDMPKNKLKKILIKIPLFRLIFSSIKNKELLKNYPDAKESSLFLKTMMKSLEKEVKKISPNAKLIIILYDQKIADIYSLDKIKFDYENQNSKIWNELQQETDITVVHSKDIVGFLFDKDYKLKKDVSDWHPSEKTWEVFTPLFAEKYIK